MGYESERRGERRRPERGRGRGEEPPDRGRGGGRRGGGREAPIPDLLIPAILVTIFCCQIGGIIAIIYAAQANGSRTAGDYARGAQQARTAKTWIWISAGTGVAVILVYALVMIAGGVAMHS